MDKYTVDLDKVLNDFEYSELTDQYNSSKGKCNETNYSTPHRNDSTSSFKISSAKHSINNVFQSLNEYLNTDIRSPEQNYESDNVNTCSVEFNDKETVNNVGNVFGIKVKGDLKEFINNDLNNQSTCLKTDKDNTNKSYNVNTSANCQKVNNETVKSKVNNSNGGEHEENAMQVMEGEMESMVGSCIENFDLISVTTTDDIDIVPNDVVLKKNALLIDTDNLIEDKEVIQGENNLKPNLDNNLDTATEEELDVKGQDNNKETEIIPENKQKIGFDAIDVDEAELAQYLNELEDDYDEPSDKENNTAQVCENGNINVNSVNEEQKSEDVEPISQKNTEIAAENTPELGETSDSNFSTENLQSDLKIDLMCTVEKREIPKTHEQSKEENIEGEEHKNKSVTEANENEGSKFEVQNKEKVESLEIPVESSEQVVNVLKEPETQTSRRPSVLEVKSVLEEEPQKVETNVLGKPGSTPYVYKAFDANDDTESDIDSSSASPSPTFSDMSTVSSATTATIDSCNNSLEQNLPGNDVKNDNERPTRDLDNDNAQAQQTFDDREKTRGGAKNDGDNANTDVPSSDADTSTRRGDPEGSTETAGNPVVANEAGGDVAVATGAEISEPVQSSQGYCPESWLGKQAPLWIPDSEALNCLHCDMKFTIIKRRHHCRACGLVLCSKCCNLQHRLEYLDAEARVCNKCYEILTRENEASSGSEVSPSADNSPAHQGDVQPNPNNPMEYCSMVPPLQQVSGSSQNPPTVMVPVSVLKRKGSGKTRKNKSVMFCDGIRPGSELTNLDNDFNYSESKIMASQKILASPPPKVNRNVPEMDNVTKSFIPAGDNDLPPIVSTFKSDISYREQTNDENLLNTLKTETLSFAIQKNLYVNVRLIDMSCCMNNMTWCFSTEGLISVGQDEIVILLEKLEDEKTLPKDIFLHLNNIYIDAKKGSNISELGLSLHPTTFLGSKNHAGFLYIHPTHQCLKNVIIPKEPYLIGVLIHRWEIPWAKIFPLRLVLRLGAEYKMYPCPIVSYRHRESVYVEIGHTIITLLADFRNFSYTLPNIRGLLIHMEDKITTVTIPSNRYDKVMKSINNSTEHSLAFGGNFSNVADAHLVCAQDTQGKNENNYTTLTISIETREIKVKGASFIVFNGNLKSTSGLTAKLGVIEDGLIIHIPMEKMEKLREDLRNMKDHTIECGPINGPCDETVKIVWGENDVNFNVGVLSPIDNEPLSGIPSIRVHNGKDYVCNSGNRLIRWTEVFILQNGDENTKGQEIDYSKISESIARATCQALVKYLDLLSSNNFYKIGIRTNLHTENVSYSGGSNGIKLPPIYMKSLDNELIPVLLRITSNNWGDSTVVLELIFRVLNV